MKRKFAKNFVAVVTLLSLCVSNTYAYTNIGRDFYMRDNETYLGKIIPSEISDAAFSNEIDYDSLTDLQFQRAISVSGDHIFMDLSLFNDSSEVQLQYEGKLYKSYRYTDESPVYIGAFENASTASNQNDEFEIIYFEISDDISPYNLDEKSRELASITMYLRSSEGTIYDLSSRIDSPIILNGVNDLAPSDKDLNWFLKYFNGTYEEVPNDSQVYAPDESWTGDMHKVTFKVAGYEHMYLASPFMDFIHGDVPHAGEKTFGMSLKISESHRYRYTGETNWTIDNDDYAKCFTIDNVQLTWTAGANTKISYVTPHLNVHNKGGGSFHFTGIAAAVTGIFPETATLSAILAAADSILSINIGESTEFTNTSDGGLLTNTSVYKVKFPENYRIEESGYGLDNPRAERFEIEALMVTDDKNLSRNVPTHAVADFRFNLNWGDGTGKKEYKVYNDYVVLDYSVNV